MNAGDTADAVVLVLTTLPDAARAEELARRLLEEHLIACANLLPGVRSLFRWNGELQQEAEVLVLMKTRRRRVPELLRRVPELHPYELPEVLALPVEAGLDAYCAWVVTETTRGRE